MSMSSPASPSLSSTSHGPRPLQLLVDGNLQSPTLSSCPSPTASGLSTPPPSARKFNARRQSSIAYYPSDHTPTWDLRSPTAASGSGSSLKRSTSLNQRPKPPPERLSLRGDRRSLPASDVLASSQAERPPLTLTENSSVRFSQSSASSLAFDEPAEGASSPTSSDDSEREVAVKRTSICVDGGTGIESVVEISPASASRTAKLHRRKSREAPLSPSLLPSSPSPASALATASNGGSGSGASRGRAQMQDDYKRTIKRSSLHITAGGSIPPAASIPGLGPLASPLASAWMGSVGSSVGKNSASPSARSLLEEDDDAVGDAALGSVLVPDTKPPAHHTPSSSSSAASAGVQNTGAPSKSLLDDDDDEEWNW
ncbi:hypothetical protein FKP32DRAFT_1610564 [Trametes sanguinea]|nr:hypothetical protein FKP32DRAFT_1610564 [Trametes sanguinea]